MLVAQIKYEESFDKRVLPSKKTTQSKDFAFVKQKFYEPHDKNHKLSSATKGTFRMVSVTETAVVVRMREREKRLMQDRVVEAPSTKELLRKEVLHNKDEKN